jgi:hypothetical protein
MDNEPMTREEALQEAQRRWGNDAYVWKGTSGKFYVEPGGKDLFYGASWEAAFADADRRERK